MPLSPAHALLVPACVVFALGAMLLLRARSESRRLRLTEEPPAPAAQAWGAVTGWADRLSTASRMVVGLALLLAGYHLAAYVLPDAWLPLRVPLERWWMLALGLVIAVGASLGMDRWEGR